MMRTPRPDLSLGARKCLDKGDSFRVIAACPSRCAQNCRVVMFELPNLRHAGKIWQERHQSRVPGVLHSPLPYFSGPL